MAPKIRNDKFETYFKLISIVELNSDGIYQLFEGH